MAHEIENMLYVGEIPWHRLGVPFQEPPTIKEAILAAGLNWEVGTKELFTEDGQKVPSKATYRTTDNKILGVVGPNYQPLQNSEAFEFFEPFLASKEASIETAGSLREGKRVWVMAKINKDPSVIVPKVDDKVDKYVLLSNSHDGTMAVRVGFTPIRVVCANTMAFAIGHAGSQLMRIRHSGNVVDNLEKIREAMSLANQQFEANAELFRELSKRNINTEDLEKYVKSVFAVKADDEDEGAGKRVMGDIVRLFEGGRGNDLEGVRGTYWAAYNAVSEYLQYERGNDGQVRLDSLWFGQSARLNKKALDIALKQAA